MRNNFCNKIVCINLIEFYSYYIFYIVYTAQSRADLHYVNGIELRNQLFSNLLLSAFCFFFFQMRTRGVRFTIRRRGQCSAQLFRSP